MYSQGMVGFGHIRRNATIAHALRGSSLQPAIVMIAEAWQAGALPLPPGVDCVTLPGLRQEANGEFRPRSLDVSDRELIALRASVICSALQALDPDVLIVDHLPLGIAGELVPSLEWLRANGPTRCVLGLRDVLQDPDTLPDRAHQDAIRNCYDAIWVYGDPAVHDPVREDGALEQVADKVRYTGYLDQRPRLEFIGADTTALLSTLPRGKLALCVVGGGQDGGALADAFAQAEIPPGFTGVLVTGPYMPEETRHRLRRIAEGKRNLEVFEFVPDPVALIERADRIIAMGGYNTVCEVLSFEKHALIVPRVHPKPEQWVRARRMRDLGLVHLLHPDELTPAALSDWLGQDLGPAPASRSRVDVEGLTRIPTLLAELLGISLSPVPGVLRVPSYARR